MVDYRAIDAILMPWAERHELHVYARERDASLRSIIIYYWAGPRHESAGHMWLEGPGTDGVIAVHGAAPGWHQTKSVSLDRLEAALEAMFQTMIARPTFD